ncbi:unnamed protein product, partial [Phaeothamnion confervicola]
MRCATHTPACDFHPGAAFCVRSAALPDGGVLSPGNQCCYDTAGQIVTEMAKGGGTADRYRGVPASFVAHIWSDVISFDVCCKCPAGSAKTLPCCELYRQARPIDDGRG